MEPTFYEKEYLNIIKTLEEIVEKEEKGKESDGDFESGVSFGREGLAKDLVIQMQSVVINAHYGEL